MPARVLLCYTTKTQEAACLALMEGYLPCLKEERPLPEGLDRTFGAGSNWHKIPVLSLEKELVYEV